MHERVPAVDEVGEAGAVDERGFEDVEGHEGEGGAVGLPEDEERGDEDAGDECCDDVSGEPGVVAACPDEAEDEEGRGGEGEEHAGPVYGEEFGQPVAVYLFEGHHEDDAEGDDGAEGQVQPEDPAPGVASDLDKGAAHDGTDAVGDGDCCAEDALPFAALSERDDIADDCLGDGRQSTTADTSEGAEDDELSCCLSKR